MQFDRCKSCGGDLERIGNYYVCRFCGSKWMIDADNDVHVIDRANAWSALRDCDFERATELFENIIYKEPQNHEAYWGRALASAGIMYVTDFHENKKVPTCNSISESSFIENRDVKKAIELAPADIAENYRTQAEQIEAIRVEWVRKASREPAYDVFICYKDSDREHNIERTDDSYDAHELYNSLTAEGYKVFFSRVSLRDKVSEHYEPYIYNALKTAKVMVVFGEKPEYFNAVWVKNEWMRFRKRIELGEKNQNSLVVAYKGFDPADLPVGLRSRQCLDAGSMTFLEDLKRHIAKIVREPKKVEEPKVTNEPMAVEEPAAKGEAPEKPRRKKGIIIAAIALVLAVCIGIGFIVNNLADVDGETTPVIPHETEFVPLPTDKETSVTETVETEGKTDAETKTETEINSHVCSFGKWVTIKEANCTENGEQERTCTCGEKETQIIDAIGHDEEMHEAQAPTCTEVGWNSYVTCSSCDYTTYHQLSKLEHDYIDKICTRCGELCGSEGLEYISNNDGTCYVSGIGTCIDTDLIIPRFSPEKQKVIGISKNAFSSCGHIVSVVIGDNITSIGENAFLGCTALKSVVIPDSVTNIGYFAFSECENLTDVTMPAFAISYIPRSNLQTVLITSGDSICDYAFKDCSALTSIAIPDSITSIGNYAFNGCSSLTSIAIPDSVTSIGYSAFYNCTTLTSVHITDISAWCSILFDGYFASPMCCAKNIYCDGALVTELTIPNGVTSISDYAFYNFRNLTSVVIPNSVISIGYSAFYNCNNLISIQIPDSVTNIASYAFWNSSSLTEINVDANNEYYCSIDGNLYSKDGSILVQYAIGKTSTTFTIPSSVKSIDCAAFAESRNLTNVVIPDSVTSICERAFYGCALTNVVIGDSVTRIDDYAFACCFFGLTSVEIPNSVTSIGDYAFYYCDSITSVVIPDSVTSIGFSAFEDCSCLTTVYYTGSETEWNAISKYSGWDRDTGQYTVIYNYTGE